MLPCLDNLENSDPIGYELNMTPQGVLETVLYAADLEATERFYVGVLGLTVLDHQPGHHVFFRSGQGVVLVFNPAESATHDIPIKGVKIPRHGAHGPGHVCFRIPEAEIDTWRGHLMQCSVPLEAEITWPQGGHSLYFRDPAGNSLEVATARLWGLPEWA